MKKLFSRLALAATAVGLCVAAQATPTLYYWNPSSSNWDALAVDNGAGDSNPMLGVVAFTGATTPVPGFNFNLTGTTMPLVGTNTSPYMDLDFWVYSATGVSHTLKVAFSSDNLGPTDGFSTAAIAVNSSSGTSLLDYWSHGGTSNALADVTPANLITSIGSLTGIDHATDAGGSFMAPAPYSLTQVVEFTSNSASTLMTGNASLGLSVPDAGTTVALLGIGLTTLALASSRKRRTA